MNITSWDIYWITRLDSIKGVATGISIVISISVVILCMVLFSAAMDTYDDEKSEKYFHLLKCCAFLFLIPVFLFVGSAFIPTTKAACMMYAVPKLTNSECVKALQGDAKELYTLGIKRLKEELAVKGGKDGTK